MKDTIEALLLTMLWLFMPIATIILWEFSLPLTFFLWFFFIVIMVYGFPLKKD